MSYWKSYYNRRPLGDQHVWWETNMPHLRPIRDQHAWSETDMSDRRLIGDHHAWLENHWRHVWSEIYVYLTTDQIFNISHQLSIFVILLNNWKEGSQFKIFFLWYLPNTYVYIYCGFPIKHLGLRRVSNPACWYHNSDQAYWSTIRPFTCQSPMGLWSDMLVSDGSPIKCQSLMRHVGLR